MKTLSVTWRMRLLNSLLSAVTLTALVSVAQIRIKTVLYNSVDEALRAQAMLRAGERMRGPGGGGWRNGPPMPTPGNDGRHHGNHPNPRATPPPLRFGTVTLRPPVYLADDRPNGPEVLSALSLAAARKNGDDMRDVTDSDGESVRVYSLRVPPRGKNPGALVQATAPLGDTIAALEAVQGALFSVLLPLGLISGFLGALFTDVALAPVRQLSRAVSDLDAANLSARLPAPGGGDSFDRLVMRLNALLARLDAAFARQKRFTGDASHELRTPLSTIKAATSLLLENPETLSEFQTRALSGADQSVDRATRLIADLLLLARTENGVLPMRVQEVSLAKALQDAIYASETNQESPHASVLCDAPNDLIIWTDPDHLHRLVVNLVSNALRHTPPSGRVNVSAIRNDTNTLGLVVADTGEGIPSDALPFLGEPFYRPDSARARTHGGAGLGLALCRGIAAALGGTISIDSALGEGTTVTVLLPCTALADVETAALLI